MLSLTASPFSPEVSEAFTYSDVYLKCIWIILIKLNFAVSDLFIQSSFHPPICLTMMVHLPIIFSPCPYTSSTLLSTIFSSSSTLSTNFLSLLTDKGVPGHLLN